MFNHQYNFEIEIPKEAISREKHDKIFTELLDNKVIIGLIGYARSGKDTIAKKFVDKYGFHRVAFADNVKIEMNKYLRESVYNYLSDVSTRNPLDPSVHSDICGSLILEDMRLLTIDMVDFQTEDIAVKKRLRPFIIWYGEKMREINGPYYWVNRAFQIDADGYNNIILSDVRRTMELDIFMNSNSFKRRSDVGFAAAGVENGYLDTKLNSHSSLLFHVSQLGLKDTDVLTHECIRVAEENWLFDHTFYIDPRLPEPGPYRNNSSNFQVKEVAKKFGINVPDKTIAYGRRTSLLD